MTENGKRQDRAARLQQLFDLQLDACIEVLQRGDASAAALNIVRQFLGDNGIDINSLKRPAIPSNLGSLPFTSTDNPAEDDE
jgi:hypothetical protein